MSRTLTISQARSDFADTVNRVAFTKERIILKRRGKKVAAILPIEDLDELERAEEVEDIAAAKKAMKEKGGITLSEFKRKLGL
jgi:prevent-host-death family protein